LPACSYDDGSGLMLVAKGGLLFAYDLSPGGPAPGSQEQVCKPLSHTHTRSHFHTRRIRLQLQHPCPYTPRCVA
jgi:hypothetical protein